MFARNMLAALALICAAPALAGCSDAADDIDQYSDCIDICGRFQCTVECVSIVP